MSVKMKVCRRNVFSNYQYKKWDLQKRDLAALWSRTISMLVKNQYFANILLQDHSKVMDGVFNRGSSKG